MATKGWFQAEQMTYLNYAIYQKTLRDMGDPFSDRTCSLFKRLKFICK